MIDSIIRAVEQLYAVNVEKHTLRIIHPVHIAKKPNLNLLINLNQLINQIMEQMLIIG